MKKLKNMGHVYVTETNLSRTLSALTATRLNQIFVWQFGGTGRVDSQFVYPPV